MKKIKNSNTHENVIEPFFLVGYRRSGTTLLRNMLNAHPRIAVISESHFMAYFYDNMELYGDLNDDCNFVAILEDISRMKRFRYRKTPFKIKKIADEIYPRELDVIFDYLNKLYAQINCKEAWGDKTPYFLYRMEMLLYLFPNCKIIHMVRDPRAAISSQIEKFREFDININAKMWVKGLQQVEKNKDILNKTNFLEVRYEDLVTWPDQILKEISNFLSIEYRIEMIHYYKFTTDDVGHAKSIMHFKPISTSRLEVWKNKLSRRDIFRIEKIASFYMEKYGYRLVQDNYSLHKENYLERKNYEIISRLKTISNPFNFKIVFFDFFWKFITKLAFIFKKLSADKICFILLRFRIRYAQFDQPRNW